MAPANPSADEYETVNTDVNATDDANPEWEEIPAEQQIVLEGIGDFFTGTYHGMDMQKSGIWQAHFTLNEGTDAFINAGHDLKQKLDKVAKESFVKVTWESELNTGQRTPMRVYRVQVRR
jgi:hypothetical protein